MGFFKKFTCSFCETLHTLMVAPCSALLVLLLLFSPPTQTFGERPQKAWRNGRQKTATTRWPNYAETSPGNFMSFGNHRFNFTVEHTPEAAETPGPVLVTAVWRRSDSNPGLKAVFITGDDQKPISCQNVGTVTADNATFMFTPPPTTAGRANNYFIYYMPLMTCEYEGGGCEYGAQANYIKAGTEGSCTSGTKVGSGGTLGPQYTAVYEARAPFESFVSLPPPRPFNLFISGSHCTCEVPCLAVVGMV